MQENGDVMAELRASYDVATDVLATWRDDVLSGKPPILYPVGKGALAGIEIGPGLVTLIGGPPGAGKTALTMQILVDALRLTPTLRAIVCNVEMPPATLLDRQLARLSGIDLTTIRHRRLGSEHADRIKRAMSTLEPLCERFCFVRSPFDLQNVAESADDFHADLLVLDYIQRIMPPGKHGDRRGAVDASMSHLRKFADEGIAVVVVAAVARSRDSKGRSTYAEGLSLASFRESSELEFGADDAFILAPYGNGETMTLRHLKSRHGEPRDLSLHFDRKLQRFSSVSDAPEPVEATGERRPALTALWNRTPEAPDDDNESEHP
jgi:replicative DNA helicase